VTDIGLVFTGGATAFGQEDIFIKEENPGIVSHISPLLDHTSHNWFISNQVGNTAFSRSAAIASTRMNVQKTGDLQFPCHKCHKVYTWKANLNRHLRLECGKKPHLKCPYCMYITNRKTSVQEHIRRRHKDLPNIA
jgi:hypothetical protein